jgi:RimJ/RimL family protein N-acetyltransferase
MPATLRTLINEFMIPYMNVHVLTGDFFEHNSASKRVFEKTGFELWQTASEVHELPESKTGVKGKKISLGVMRWTRKL